MFAGLLNKGFRGSLVLLISVFLLCLIAGLFSTNALETNIYPNLFYNFFTSQITNKISISLINFLFIGLGVLLVSFISVNQEVVDKLNYFPVFMFLLLSVAGANPFQVSPFLVSNVFILFSLYKLLNTYRSEKSDKDIFEAAFCLSFACFISISVILFLPLFFVTLLILRSFNWREWFIGTIGIFVPIFIYECLSYLTNFNQWYMFEASYEFFATLKTPYFSEYYIPILFINALLLIISLAFQITNGFGNTVKKQRAKSIFLWYMVFCIPAVFSGGANSNTLLLTYALPFSFLMGDFLYAVKRLKVSNTLLTLFMLSVIIILLGRFSLI